MCFDAASGAGSYRTLPPISSSVGRAAGWRAAASITLHFRATLVSPAPREELEKIQERVLSHNMVLGGLRGVPRTSELITLATAGDGRRATVGGVR